MCDDFRIMKIFCSFKFELLANDVQRSALSRNAGCRRFVFNKALALQNERKDQGLKLLNYCEMASELVRWKKNDETSFLKEAMSQPLQQALRDLDQAIRNSFRPKSDPARKEWPRFKVKDIGDGFRIPQNPVTLTTPTGASSFRKSVGSATAKAALLRSNPPTAP